jgi:hypothetical protein
VAAAKISVVDPLRLCRRLPAVFLALAAAFTVPPLISPQMKTDAEKPFDLAAFLKTAAEDCRRLEGAVLDFTCREMIEEKVDLTRDIDDAPAATPDWSKPPGSRLPPGATILSRSTARYRHTLVHHYQCVRDPKGLIRETRTLLEENGRSRSVPEVKLGAANLDYGRAFLAPVALFAERFQRDFDYAVVGRAIVEGTPVVIVEAKPKPEAMVAPNISGKAWVEPAAGAMLKVEWDESRVGRHAIFRERGEKYKMIPLILVTAEFGVARNALRFPTKLVLEEAYFNARGRKFVRSETTAEYAGFEFFTVEVKIK